MACLECAERLERELRAQLAGGGGPAALALLQGLAVALDQPPLEIRKLPPLQELEQLLEGWWAARPGVTPAARPGLLRRRPASSGGGPA
jgi:hypothetical protein